jgi:ribonuclease BN (tRNA processing enzyme)
VKITVLGKSPAWQDAGGACSGYLVEAGGTRLLVDCGNGVFAKLREVLDYVDVTAVVLSHMHADHCLDVIPFAYALTYAPRQQPVPVAHYPGTDEPARPRLIVPADGGVDALRTLGGLWGDVSLVENAFAVEEYDPADVLEVGDVTLRFASVPHYVPTCAIEVVERDGPRLTYGADCSPNDAIVAFARDTDLLILEATLPRPERGGMRGHLTSEEAGDHARRAGARRLVITHISDELDLADAGAAASEHFGAPAEVAADGRIFEI